MFRRPGEELEVSAKRGHSIRLFSVLILVWVLSLMNVPVAHSPNEISSTGQHMIDSLDSLRMLRNQQDGTGYSILNEELHLPANSYPLVSEDGRPLAPDPPRQQKDRLIEELRDPPYNTGGGYSTITESLGEYQVGVTHEYFIGDQNGNGVLEYVVYYFHRPSSVNGLDDDGDGCVDEPTYGARSGQSGCDHIPDAMTYFETGTDVFLGGEEGNLAYVVDRFGREPSLKIYRIGVTPRFSAYRLRGSYFGAQAVGDFLSYYSREDSHGLNSNPEMDSDFSDYFVGSIDVREFPARPPVNHVCSAGIQSDTRATSMRDDGWVVTSYNLVESYDDHDWNGDGDTKDHVAAYYAVHPNSSNCRENVVNTGVHGWLPRNSGALLFPEFTSDSGDNRDWDMDGSKGDYAWLYHDINSTMNLRGRVYTSVTFTQAVPAWGFGWWGYLGKYEHYQDDVFPLKFGRTFYRYISTSMTYHTYAHLVSDEDGNRHTPLPTYHLSKGFPRRTFDGRCILIEANERYLYFHPINGIIGDLNGNGYVYDTVYGVFCPDEAGGGGTWVSKGGIRVRIGDRYEFTQWAFTGLVSSGRSDYVVRDSVLGVAVAFCHNEWWAGMDLDGDFLISFSCIHLSYFFPVPK